MPKWLANLPSNYTAQMALMGWFLTLTSKMTGFTIPDVGLAPGGKIEQSRDAIAHYLLDMETIADAMAVDKYWDRPQYAILKEMYLDLKRMHYSFRVIQEANLIFGCPGTRALASSAPCPRCPTVPSSRQPGATGGTSLRPRRRWRRRRRPTTSNL